MPWIDLADSDIDAVRRSLVPDPDVNGELGAYHCQQAAEKLMKALLVCAGIAYPRGSSGHDLALAASRLPDDHPLRDAAQALTVMTPWATAFRYPADDPLTQAALPDASTLANILVELKNFRDAVVLHVKATESAAP